MWHPCKAPKRTLVSLQKQAQPRKTPRLRHSTAGAPIRSRSNTHEQRRIPWKLAPSLRGRLPCPRPRNAPGDCASLMACRHPWASKAALRCGPLTHLT